MKFLLFVAAMAALACLALAKPAQDCTYWCKNPEGFPYCCQKGVNKDPVRLNSGICPPQGPTCYTTFSGPKPLICAQDGQCKSQTEKCCYDTCLHHPTCKPIIQRDECEKISRQFEEARHKLKCTYISLLTLEYNFSIINLMQAINLKLKQNLINQYPISNAVRLHLFLYVFINTIIYKEIE